MTKKIAFITTNDAHMWGGSEDLWSRTALHLTSQNVGVGVSIKKWDKPVERISQIEAKGGEIFYRGHQDALLSNRILARLKPYQQKARKKAEAEKWMDSYRPDLIVISLGHNFQGVDWMTACIKRKIPYVVLVQLASEYKWPNDSEAQPFIDGYTKAVKSFFVSQANIDLTQLQLGTLLPNAEVVRNAFNVPFDADVSWPSTENGFKLATVASLSCYHKGHDVVLQVLSDKKWQERPISLNLVGKGPHEENIKRIIKNFNIKNVTLSGFKNSIVDVWREHHALIMGSRIEGLPLALVEAMLCKRVPIVTDVAGNSELVKNEQTGFLAKAPTPELIDEALENAWNNRDNWENIGINAYQKVKATIPENPVEVFANRLLSLIK